MSHICPKAGLPCLRVCSVKGYPQVPICKTLLDEEEDANRHALAAARKADDEKRRNGPDDEAAWQ